MDVSAHLRVLDVFKSNAVGQRNGHENETEELGGEQL